MGTVVSAGSATAVVYATGLKAEFGKIAAGLGERQPETEFQVGLRRFSYLLLRVALTLTVLILVINLLLRRPIIEAVLFSLAIAVGITPQLLPAVVSTSLATGSRRLADLRVLVKRLVCIEDLGDIDVLITDKTGTLTEGRVTLIEAVDPTGRPSLSVLRAGLLSTDVDPAVGGTSANPLDAALWESTAAQQVGISDARRIAELPFDHERRANSTLVEDSGRTLVHKGAPEQVLERCVDVPDTARRTLEGLFADGRRVVAVATRPAPDLREIAVADEKGLALQGFLVFADQPKVVARDSLGRLAELGIEVKVATGDNPQVAEKVCADLGLPLKGTYTGAQLSELFGLMLGVLHAGPPEFRTGWFVESLATQTLIIFAIRTRRIPFFRSRPGGVLAAATLAVIAIGVVLTISPLAPALGFAALPWQFFAALALFVIAYLVLVEITKAMFYAEPIRAPGLPPRTRGREHRIHRRAARFSHSGRL